MKHSEIAAQIGKKGNIITGGFRINVKVLDFKTSYGKDRWLVTPLSGEGEVWTEQSPISTE